MQTVTIDGVEYQIKKIGEKFLILQKPDGGDWSVYMKLVNFWQDNGRLVVNEPEENNGKITA